MAVTVPSLTFSNGYSVPIFGLGTWKSKPGEVAQAVRDAIDIGYRHFDCAYIYRNEKEVGDGIRDKIAEGVVKRSELFITSKLWNTFHRPDLVIPACKKTLENLGLDYLDLYLIHWPIGYKEYGELIPKTKDGKFIYSFVDYVDTWPELEKCVDMGLVRSLGLSNFNSQQVERVLAIARIKPVNNQVESNPYLNQKKLLQFCKEKGILLTGYSPLGSPDSPFLKQSVPMLLEDPKLKKVAEKYNKSVAQVVLRYQVQRDIITIPKSVNKARLLQNISIFDFELSPEDMAYIDTFDCGSRLCILEHAKQHPHYPFNIEF